jgi:acyl carrier protein
VQKIAQASAPQHFLHVYGPTENTTFSLWKKITNEYLASTTKIALGQSLSNGTAFLLNAVGEPVPLGVQGELYLGGDGLARGYLNRTDLTDERFGNRFGQRLYRTGDIVKQLANGDLEFIGRVDHQVKIRGFRIELGEIENCLRNHEGVREALVLARETFAGSGDKRLVAYVVAKVDTEDFSEHIRSYLQQQLPAYMQPSALLVLPALPLNANGKLDRKALPEPELLSRAEFVAPESETELRLSALWQSLLAQQQIGLHDNFFDLGGHSLLATRLLSQANREFGVSLAIRDLFALQTLAEQAAYIDDQLQMERGLAGQVDATADEEGAEVWEL